MSDSVLIIGESGVGKTHYGAKLLMQLQQDKGSLSMDGTATNIEPFNSTMEQLHEGLTSDHTPSNVYVESRWPIKSENEYTGEIIWPDYGGEQILNITKTRSIPDEWYERVANSNSWLIMLRPSQYRLPEDLISKPTSNISTDNSEMIEKEDLTDQTRLIELLQILIYSYRSSSSKTLPKVCFLLSCWDELETKLTPCELLRDRLPMFFDFIHASWHEPLILGLSALGKKLDSSKEDKEYLLKGPENIGYIVESSGSKNIDLTLPVKYVIDRKQGWKI
jgi:GTPase SAR1 family protein